MLDGLAPGGEPGRDSQIVPKDRVLFSDNALSETPERHSAMNDELKAGDLVTWAYADRVQTGVYMGVSSLFPSYARIALDDNFDWIVPIRRLTRLTDTALVQAVAAQPQDDADRESALASLRVPGTFAHLVDDYAEAILRNAGDLGGVELV